MSDADELIVWRDGPLGRLRLNRPKTLNALTLGMTRGINEALTTWRDDATVAAVVIDAQGDKAFCAGGDIIDLYTVGKAGDPEPGRGFWREEYRLNALIGSYPKPYIALMDGITMGGGVGISAHGSHRIVTERTMLAMPETGIGFLPDVGSTWILSRAVGSTGYYLGMTGARMNAADAIFSGFADHYIESGALDEFVSAMKEGKSADDAVAMFATPPPEGALASLQEKITDAFGQTTALAVANRMEEMASQGDEWAAKTHKLLRRHSPLAVSTAFEAITQAKTLSSLEDCLALEYRFSYRALTGHDFYEGVRALVIDKDKKPKWEPAQLEDVTPAMARGLLGPIGDQEWKAA